MNLNNATVLITGAAGGFGQEYIRQCLAKGSHLLLTDLDAARLEAIASTIHQEVGRGSIRQCVAADLATPEGCQQLVDAIAETPDVLINNAGLGSYGHFHETPADFWELLIQINLLAPMRLTHLLLPDMIARGGGHIVNMSSVSGWIGTLGMVPYSTSKYGLRGFGEALSEDMAQHNIRVTNVYPFYSRTPMIGAPRHGSLPEPNLSDDLVTDPAEVIRQAVAGIEADVLHLFPDRYARTLSLIKRYIPRILPRLFKRLES